MPEITLDFYVPQGCYGITPNTNLTFGTTGLATCVGIIIILDNGYNICGHLDHESNPDPTQKDVFENQVMNLLRGIIPEGTQILNVYYSTPGGTLAAKYSVSALYRLFPDPIPVNAGDRQTIYLDDTGTIQAVDANVNTGQTEINDGPFSV